jgi:hypothetical protein
MTDDAERQPWEPQGGETKKQYDAFVAFHDMGGARSLRRIARAERAPQPRRECATDEPETLGLASRNVVNEWAKKWNWTERVALWDQHDARLARQQKEREYLDEIAQERALDAQLLRRISQRLIGDETAGIDAIDVNDLSWNALARLVDLVTKQRERKRGDPTEVTQFQGPNGGPVQHRVNVAPKDAAETLARYRELENVGDLAPGTTELIRAALVALGELPRDEAGGDD